jgi:hypothetical protein
MVCLTEAVEKHVGGAKNKDGQKLRRTGQNQIYPI